MDKSSEGTADVDESLITGESQPVAKSPGAKVIAGTVAGGGSLRVSVTAVGDATALSGIMRLVSAAQASGSRAQTLADRATALLFYVALAAGTATFTYWWLAGDKGHGLIRAATVLIIACPHALGLAIPLVIAISTSLGARNGLLVKDRLALERDYPVEFKGATSAEYWLMGAMTAILFFVSIVVHELAHSWVAIRYKIPVHRITLFIFGGVSQIAGEPPSASAEFLIAVVGPLTSLALAALFLFSEPLLVNIAPALAVAKYLALINGMLGLFNLIPGFPLDGGRVFRAIVWGVSKNFRQATLIAASTGRFFGFLFIVVGVWQALRGNAGNGLCTAFIGWFLESAAGAQVLQQMVQGLLVGHKVSEVMGSACAHVPGDTSLQKVVDQEVLTHGRRCFLVDRGDRVVGLLTLHNLKEISRPSWTTTTAAQAMIPLEKLSSVGSNSELWTAMEKMGRDGINQMPVMLGNDLVGVLSRGDIVKYLHTLQQVGG